MATGLTGAVLTWNSPETLRATLKSYRDRGLNACLDQRLVLVQEGGVEECSISEAFGWEPIAVSTNLGIGGGYRRLLDDARSKYFLFLECDWLLTSSPQPQIEISIELIEDRRAEIVRLRSTKRPGMPVGALRMQNREHFQPGWLLESVFYESTPWHVFPGHIRLHHLRDIPFALARPENGSWSNNPHVARTDYLRALLDRHAADATNLEDDVMAGSYGEHALIAHAPGVFTHQRLDGTAINIRDAKYRFDHRFRWVTRSVRRRFRPVETDGLCPVCGLRNDACIAQWRDASAKR